MSTAVAVKTALTQLLGDSTGVQVSYGDDVRQPRKERIYFGDIEVSEVAPATMRATRVRTEENYTLSTIILVDSKKGQAACETRAFELLGAIEDLLATDPKLATATVDPGILFLTVGAFLMSTSVVSEGVHRTLVDVELLVKARNT